MGAAASYLLQDLVDCLPQYHNLLWIASYSRNARRVYENPVPDSSRRHGHTEKSSQPQCMDRAVPRKLTSQHQSTPIAKVSHDKNIPRKVKGTESHSQNGNIEVFQAKHYNTWHRQSASIVDLSDLPQLDNLGHSVNEIHFDSTPEEKSMRNDPETKIKGEPSRRSKLSISNRQPKDLKGNLQKKSTENHLSLYKINSESELQSLHNACDQLKLKITDGHGRPRDVDLKPKDKRSFSSTRSKPTTVLIGKLRSTENAETIEIDYRFIRPTGKDCFKGWGSIAELLSDITGDEMFKNVPEIDTEKVQKTLFFQNLQMIINKGFGELAWNDVTIVCENNPQNRLEIIEYEMEPTKIFLNVQGLKKVHILRNVNNLKVTGADETGLTKSFEMKGQVLHLVTVGEVRNGRLCLNFPDLDSYCN